MHGGRALLHVDILGIDIDACGLQIAIERQRLVDIALHDVEPHILVDAAIVAEEVAVVPLIATVGHLAIAWIQFLHVLAIVPTIIDENGQYIVASAVDMGSKVEAKGHHAILTPTQLLAVEKYTGSETNTLELNEEFLTVS